LQPVRERGDRSRPDLLRGIRRWDLVAVAINGIIGAGIFGLPARTFALIGPYSLFAFGACALVVALIVLCFAEVGSRYGDSGGPYLYARDAFGPVIGFQVGWLQWLARTTAFAANLNLLCEYLGTFWPRAAVGSGRAVIMVAVVGALTAVNVLGVRRAAQISNIFTVGKLLPLLFFIVAGMFFLEPQRYALGAAPGVGVFSQAVLLLIFAFTGFEMAAIPAGEVDDPRANLPRALLLALGVITVFYILIQVVCVGTLPGLATSTRPLADASGRFLGRAGASVILVGAVISITGNLNVLILAGSRLPYAMATRGELPRALAAVHPRYRTPHAAILLTSAVMLALALSGTFITALTISAISRLLSYAATCAALPVLRKKPGAPAAAFTAPQGPAVALAALVLSAWLLSHSTAAEAQNTAIASAVGLAVYLAYRFARRREEALPAAAGAGAGAGS
jgi:amino acid transporter